MRKVAILILVVLFSVSAISVSAADQRIISVIPDLTFSGGYANCVAHIQANYSTDSIRVFAQLSREGSLIATWGDLGTGYLYFSEKAPVSQRGEYTLTITVTINNVKQAPVSITRTY